MTFLAATNNRWKYQEIQRILAPLGHRILSLQQANVCINIEETAKTFAGNAEMKAVAVCRAANMPAIADDSGLEVDALDGAPGIYSARFAGPGASDKDRVNKLLKMMKSVPEQKRTARFVCAICCVFPDGRVIKTSGVCEGYIAQRAHKAGGFGYDPVFIEKQSGIPFSELAEAEKDEVSHRGKALRALVEKLGRMEPETV